MATMLAGAKEIRAIATHLANYLNVARYEANGKLFSCLQHMAAFLYVFTATNVSSELSQSSPQQRIQCLRLG